MPTPDPSPPPSRNIQLRAAALSVAVSVLLLVVKLVAYFITGSAAIFSDTLESVVNVLSSMFALYAVFLANRPADQDHPYGHGKIEFVSAGFEGGMIVLAAVLIGARAGYALARPQPLGHLESGIVLMGIAMLANGVLGAWLVASGRQHRSLALEADGTHLISDAATSLAAVVALGVVSLTGWQAADPLIALAMAGYIIWLGYVLLRKSAAGLMDEQDVADTKLLRQILDSHVGPSGKEPRICSYHKLRHRHSGRYHWVEFHIMVPRKWDIEKCHTIASAIEYEIELALEEGNATAHIEPCMDEHCALAESAPALA